ncbi:SURF2 Surfeit locus protein 2 [Adlercreutzia sp. R25]|uniref:SURF2 Surfeit locus protein 2 n=1 Tax=Adlercreutzia shanghongiae TaxID=3111773 RepID=UPI002DB6AB5F|nr:SURF2 Surfeit locus protein 2 [Adlercreutzia sp. R25]MEC4272562.1 SURF2 Surfeit locus protein 2 [Adlercreutzia sp. R25]
MANSKEFSHITVTPGDDDDVVIQAGVVEEAALPVEPEAFEGVEEVVEEVAGPADAADKAASPEASSAAPAKTDGYRETTLEDLEAGAMSTTQKAVIIVAVLGIIAFVAWYVLAH